MAVNCNKINVKNGSKGDDVKEVQKYLKYFKYYDKEIDGDCGAYTVRAIKEFQRDNKLTIDGIFGPKSCKASSINSKDISKSDKTIALNIWKDIMARHDNYVEHNKKEPNICYIDRLNPYEYITIAKYKDIFIRYAQWVKDKKEEPKFIYITAPKNTTTTKNTDTTAKKSTDEMRSVFVKLYTTVNKEDVQKWVNSGITDVIVQTSIALDDNNKLLEVIKLCSGTELNVHAWVLCFKYDGKWVNTPEQEKRIKNYINKIIKIEGVKGICLDYVRYSGTNPNNTKPDVITNFVHDVKTLITSYDKNLKLSACVFAEKGGTKQYYGQDYEALSEYLDYIMPMVYKYSYTPTAKWMSDATRYVVDKAVKGAKTVAILQTYKGEDTTNILPASELREDIKTVMNAGSYGYSLFYKTAIKDYPKID